MARPKHVITMADIEARSIPEPNTGCWLWLLSLDPGGYGRVTHSSPRRRFEHAHRVSCRLTNGDFPEEFEVHHKCKQRSCVNPVHLEALSYADHRAADFPNGGATAGLVKSYCLRGHLLAGDNVYLEKSNQAGGFSRRCRTCTLNRKRIERGQK